MNDDLQPPISDYAQTAWSGGSQRDAFYQPQVQPMPEENNVSYDQNIPQESFPETYEGEDSGSIAAEPINERVEKRTAANSDNRSGRESSKEYNMRILRERAMSAEKLIEQERRYREDLERQIQEYKSRSHIFDQQAENKYRAPIEPEEEISDDEVLEGRHLKKLSSAYRKEIETIKREHAAEREQLRKEQEAYRFQSDHKDWASVMTEENLDTFKRIYPEDYESALSNKSDYAKLKTLYNAITRYGILEMNEEDTRIEQNLAKPRAAASSLGQRKDSPLASYDEYGRWKPSEQEMADIRRQVARNKGYL